MPLPVFVVCSAASDGSRTASTPEALLRYRREFLATAAPSGEGPAEVADVDEVPDGSAAAAAAEAAPRVPFWLQPPSEEDWPTEVVAAAWRHFEGRTHMVGIAQAWRHGLRFILAEPGIPTTGLTTADLQAALCALLPPLPQSLPEKGFDVPRQHVHSSVADRRKECTRCGLLVHIFSVLGATKTACLVVVAVLRSSESCICICACAFPAAASTTRGMPLPRGPGLEHPHCFAA